MENVHEQCSCMTPCSQMSAGGGRKVIKGYMREIFIKKVWVKNRKEQSRRQCPTTDKDQESRYEKDDVEEQYNTRRNADERQSGS